MVTDARRLSPEELELAKKRKELHSLEVELAQRELDFATLQAELHAFERRYVSIVGVRYASLYQIKVQIAEAHARLTPNDATVWDEVQQTRYLAGQPRSPGHPG